MWQALAPPLAARASPPPVHLAPPSARVSIRPSALFGLSSGGCRPHTPSIASAFLKVGRGFTRSRSCLSVRYASLHPLRVSLSPSHLSVSPLRRISLFEGEASFSAASLPASASAPPCCLACLRVVAALSLRLCQHFLKVGQGFISSRSRSCLPDLSDF